MLQREGEMRDKKEIGEGDSKKPLMFVIRMPVEFIAIDGLLIRLIEYGWMDHAREYFRSVLQAV